MASKFKLAISGILCSLLLWGAYEHVFNTEPNKCHMTFMFEYPQFIPIQFPASVKKLFPHYHLYSYGEGNYSEVLREGHYAGVPVLFIPGNGGSYRQVRSLASVAYRKALDDETDFMFDFFTVDLNEELGAFYGPALERQTEFVTYAVKQILKLYEKRKSKPNSVVLVGHSMGGMIARALFISENITASTVPLIITQATPHMRPVIMIDYHLKEFYEKVNDYWTSERGCKLKDVILITVGGGRNDIQVATSHTSTPFADIATTTANVPYCWLTADHQAIVWCKQLVMATVRALFDIVDPSTRQITTNRQRIINVFEFHLAKRITGKKFKWAAFSEKLVFDESADWLELETRQETYIANKTDRFTYLTIPLNPSHRLFKRATIIATNLGKRDWVMACKTEMKNEKKMCIWGENLSQKSKKLYGKVKAIQLKLPWLSKKGYTDLAVLIGPTKEQVEVAVDVHSENGRHRSVEVPVFIRSFTQTLVVDTTPQKALSYNVSLVGLEEPWQSFKFMLRPRQKCEGQVVTAAMMYFPWASKEIYVQQSGQTVYFNAELDLPPPPGDNSTASIQFFLNPQCTYSVIIQGSFIGVFRRLIWLYGTQVPTYCAVHLLLALSSQLKSIGEDCVCPSFFSAAVAMSPITIVPFVKIINLIMYNLDITDDFTVMSNNSEHLGILPIILFLGMLPLTLIVGLITWGLVVFAGNAAHSFVIRVFGCSVGGSEVVADIVVGGLSRFPLLVGVALISLSVSSCGTLALFLSVGFYFIKIFRMYEDHIHTFVKRLIPTLRRCTSEGEALSSIHLHITLLLLVSLIAAFNIPSLIIWGKSVKHSLQLQEDPSLFVTVSLLFMLCLLWQKDIPRTDRSFYKHLSYAVHGIAVATLLFGSIHVYRVPYFLLAAILIITLHQVFAPFKSEIPVQKHKQNADDIDRLTDLTEFERDHLVSEERSD